MSKRKITEDKPSRKKPKIEQYQLDYEFAKFVFYIDGSFSRILKERNSGFNVHDNPFLYNYFKHYEFLFLTVFKTIYIMECIMKEKVLDFDQTIVFEWVKESKLETFDYLASLYIVPNIFFSSKATAEVYLQYILLNNHKYNFSSTEEYPKCDANFHGYIYQFNEIMQMKMIQFSGSWSDEYIMKMILSELNLENLSLKKLKWDLRPTDIHFTFK